MPGTNRPTTSSHPTVLPTSHPPYIHPTILIQPPTMQTGPVHPRPAIIIRRSFHPAPSNHQPSTRPMQAVDCHSTNQQYTTMTNHRDLPAEAFLPMATLTLTQVGG